MYKVEFHVHSIASKDSFLNRYLMLFMAKLKKIDCLAITDHNEVKFAMKNKDFFEKRKVKIIVGEEIFTQDGEVIGLFLTKKIQPNLTAEDTIKEIREQGGLVYIPHPYDEKRQKTVLKEECIESLSGEIDLIEKHNGRNISETFSKKQNELAEKYGLRKVVGSDAHIFYELGRNYCMLEKVDKENLLYSLEKGVFHERKFIKIAHFNTKLVKLLKLLMKGDIDEICRVINRKFKRRK